MTEDKTTTPGETPVYEWDAPPGQPLRVPVDVIQRCHLCGNIYNPSGAVQQFWCEDVKFHKDDGCVTLTGVLFDTSDRFGGNVVRKRMTWQKEARLYNMGVSVLTVSNPTGLARTLSGVDDAKASRPEAAATNAAR